MKRDCVSSFGLKVMQKLETGRRASLLKNGGVRVGNTEAPASLLKNLASQDLIAFHEGESVALSEVGRMYLRRMKSVQSCAKGKQISSGVNIFRSQHSRIVIEKKAGSKSEKVRRNIGETPLGWLLRRKDKDGRPHITEDQFEAGEKLAEDYEYAGLMARTVSYYDGVPISGKKYFSGTGENQTVTQVAARQRVRSALEYVGPGLSDILVRVCCYHEGLELAEKNLTWPTRSAKLVLKIALDRLVDFYKPGKLPNR